MCVCEGFRVSGSRVVRLVLHNTHTLDTAVSVVRVKCECACKLVSQISCTTITITGQGLGYSLLHVYFRVGLHLLRIRSLVTQFCPLLLLHADPPH